MEKTCGTCGGTKDISEFCLKRNHGDGYSSICRSCHSIYSKEWYVNNEERTKKKHREWKINNKEQLKIKNKIYYDEHKDIIAKKVKIYNSINEEKKRERGKKYYQENKEKVRKRIKNRVKIRMKEDSMFRFTSSIRSRLITSLKKHGYKKDSHSEMIFGCSFEFLQAYLSSKFTKGMTWENRGTYGWHVDHIIPLSSAKTEEDNLKLWHYTNLQPLWAKDNMKKRDKIIEGTQLILI